jgi:hypothetical protein
MVGGNRLDIEELEATEVLAGQVVINMDGPTSLHTSQITLESEVSTTTVLGPQR